MKTYRLFSFGPDGQFRGHTELDCADDGAAIRVAEFSSRRDYAELWEGDRLVRRFGTVPEALKAS